MALTGKRPGRNWNTMNCEEFSYSNLINKLQELKGYGFFYRKEWFSEDESGGKYSIWNNHRTWLEKVISEKWLQKSFKEISMEFVHFLSGERMYLHICCEKYGSGKAKGARLFTNGKPSVVNESFMIENKGTPCFEMVLTECDMYENSSEFRPISEYGIRRMDESFYTAMCKNQYAQTKVTEHTYSSEKWEYECWAGEFVREADDGIEESEYLYLIQVLMKPSAGENIFDGKSKTSAKYYMLKTKEKRERISFPKGVECKLQDMPWMNRPFYKYYDLPKEMEKVEMEVFYYRSEVWEGVFSELKDIGYEYRREQIWVAGAEEKAKNEVIKRMDGFNPEYIDLGLAEILMEFVKPETGEQIYIQIEPDTEDYFMRNGRSEERTGWGEEYFRQDRSAVASFYGEEKEEWKEAFYEEEIILPEPICLELLEKYDLIQTDGMKLCHLAGQKEFQEWFELKCFEGIAFINEKNDEEARQEALSELARARRVARGLKYSLVETREENGRKTEIYANDERDKAICLMDDGNVADIRFVDRFMDINKALSGKRRQKIYIDYE